MRPVISGSGRRERWAKIQLFFQKNQQANQIERLIRKKEKNMNGIAAGLGNPGPEYDRTRHNYGFLFIDELIALARDEGEAEELNGKKFNCKLWRVAMPRLKGEWLCAKPLTFMNNSGMALQPLLSWYKMEPESLVVIHDELDLPPGEIRFKFGGGLAGHNGLASIAGLLGSKDFYRLRIGVGKPINKENMIAWVLGRPLKEERELLDKAVSEALECFFIFSNKGLKDAAQYARDVSRENTEKDI